MLAHLARSPAVLALGAALLHSIWQIAGVALALAVVLRGLSRASSGLRYLVAFAALLLAALAPIATFIHFLPAPPPPLEDPFAAFFLSDAPLPPPSPLALALASLTVAWTAGVLFMTARFALGLARVRHLVRTGSERIDASWHRTFEELCRRLGLARVPRLLGSTSIDVPMAIGFLRPVVLVPLSILTSLPAPSVEALLAHEIAHLRRFDFAANLLLSALEAALFYHPAAHWMARCVRAEREHAADDLAAPLFGRTRYARALFELESFRGPPPEPALGSNGGSLMVRITRLLTAPPPRRARPRSALVPALIAVMALTATAAGLASCASATEPETAKSAAAAAEVRIRWLPPALAQYSSVFSDAAARHGVDADTLAIVALVESSGDPAAQSSAGAVGLMQVMPKTAARIAAQRGLADFAQDRLYEPAYNVDLGAWYFAQQIAAFGENEGDRRKVELASAAYNAGPEAVRAYLKEAKPLPEETERYTALVAGMWSERDADKSTTFSTWRERVRGRAAKKAQAPVSGGKVTLTFGQIWEGAAHQGIDVASPEGTKVTAPLDGTVVEARADGDRGNVVVIRHRGGLESRFHHLGEIDVKAGEQVAQSTTIGTVGSTGKVTGPHVHFEVRDLGSPIDPAPYLNAASNTPPTNSH